MSTKAATPINRNGNGHATSKGHANGNGHANGAVNLSDLKPRRVTYGFEGKVRRAELVSSKMLLETVKP